ncbi:hypothetical protein Tco_1166352 [Tanacetum coccineum]
MNHQTSSVPQIAYHSPQASTQPMTELPLVDSGLAVPLFTPGDDPIACLNKAIAFLTAVASLRFPLTNNQLITSSNPRNQATIQDDRGNATSSGGNNDEEQLAFLVDPGIPDGQVVQTIIPNNAAFQTENLDTYDFDYDDVSNAKAVLMANISNYGSNVVGTRYTSLHKRETRIKETRERERIGMREEREMREFLDGKEIRFL